MMITDIARAISPDAELKTTEWPGEKIREQMIEEDALHLCL